MYIYYLILIRFFPTTLINIDSNFILFKNYLTLGLGLGLGLGKMLKKFIMNEFRNSIMN